MNATKSPSSTPTKLPPHLHALHTQLGGANDPRTAGMRRELLAIGKLIAHTEATDPTARALKQLKGFEFTGTSEKVCKCCNRPF